ncbi:Alpha-ketoglutarate-dependent dioxygenase alkB-like protein 6 [Armadillidium nasatum]|uniref:Alpha-ketoglutarate-dependent dioxygenase alkB-like protein 6 n=1 Tax=Armadillidium nasatum TaxID=96803 RepID=A0A5N5SU91_9CRUS|nr:Alpha-ketoglutarate-dependent dioxygenase alkB-like protein 6 [Armadillidium nasatum]
MSLNTPIKLENFIVNKAPAKAFYIPNFINEEEEKIILKKLYEAPKPKWVQLSNRRLQNWGRISSFQRNGSRIHSIKRRSLLVLQEDLYTKYLHGIAEKPTDVIDDLIFNLDEISYSLGDILNRETRVSLTIRYFPKVLKFKLGKI